MNQYIVNNLSYLKKTLAILMARVVYVLLTVAVIPLIIKILGTNDYGIYVLITTIFTWIMIFDFGVGYGMRNELTRNIVLKNITNQKKIIQNTLVILIVLTFGIFFFLNLGLVFFNLNYIIGLPASNINLNRFFIYLIPIISLQFFFQIINPIYLSFQKSYFPPIINIIGLLIGLVLIFIVKKTNNINLSTLSICIFLGNLISNSFFLFNFLFKNKIFLNFNHFKFDRILAIKIFKNSIKYFICNISYFVTFQSINFIISNYFGLLKLTEFNTSNKIYSVFVILMSILSSSLWGTVSYSLHSKKIDVIKKIIFNLFLILIVVLVTIIFLFYNIEKIFELWIGSSIRISFGINLLNLIICVILCINSIFVQVLNGLNLLRFQVIFSIISLFFFFPATVFFIKTLNLGIYGLILSLIIFNLFSFLIAPIQVYKYLKNWKIKL